MKRAMVFKLCKDPKDAVVASDGTADWGMSSLAASDDDFRASEIARELGGQVIGLTIGTGDLAWAAARGAAETVVISDAMPSADAATTAAILAAAIRKIGDVDLVLIGDSAWDPAVPVLLGAKLGWTFLAGILEVKENESGLTVKRRTLSAEQEIEIAVPAVLGIIAQSAEETSPGLKQVLMARKKPVTKLTSADLGVDAAEAVVCRGYALPDSTEAVMINGETSEEVVQNLFDALHEEGVL